MKNLLLSSVLVVAMTVVSAADTWTVYNENHVPVKNDQEVSGASAMTPVQQLTNALAQAVSSSTIVIKPGTYDLAGELTAAKAADTDSNGVSYLTIPNKKFIIKGANTTHWSQKTAAQETVLKGGPDGRIIYGYAGNGRSSVFQHLTFEGGTASAGKNGGAVSFVGTQFYDPYKTAYASNCVFRGNSAGAWGGATTSISVYDSFFTNNIAAQGGAAHGMATSGSKTNDFISCVFVANVTTNTTSGGGAVYCDVAGRLEGCTFVANRTANNGTEGLGGAIYSKTDVPRISNCAFTNNVAANGGAIYIKDSKLNELAESTFVGNRAKNNATLYADGGYVKITDCTFKDNVAQESYAGVAAPSMALAGTVENCIFDNNTNKDANVGSQICFARQVTGCTFRGAGDMLALNYDRCLFDGCLFDYDNWGGGMILYNSSTGVGHLRNCLFQNNTMHVAIDNATGKMLEIANCTFVSNRVIRSVNRGVTDKLSVSDGYLINAFRGAAPSASEYGSPSTNRVVNCAFYNNYCHKTSSDEVERNDVTYYGTTTQVSSPAANILDHCYYETATLKSGNNSILIQADNVTNVVPKFVAGNAKYPNVPYYTPRHASPLRDAGLHLADWMEGTVDFAGNARIVGGVPDIGCYECNLPPCGMVINLRGN